jgi:uroporphyrinogen decarboxylase
VLGGLLSEGRDGIGQMATISKRERVQAALRGEVADRPPFCFWHHFRPQGSGRALAEATLDFFGRFDLDIYKVMPDLPYPFPRRSIARPDDWYLLTPLPRDAGTFGAQIRTVRQVRAAIGPDVPLVATLFSPLTEAIGFAGAERLRAHIAETPATVHGALAVIAGNLARLAGALIEAGADGIYFAEQGAADAMLSEAQFAEYGRPYAMAVLNACREGWLNVLHAHGEHDLLLGAVLDLPVQVLSWSDRLTGISLRQVRELAPGRTLMGGLHERGAITTGPAEAIVAEMRDALDQTGGRGHILAPGCSVPDDCAEAWLRAARAAVEQQS